MDYVTASVTCALLYVVFLMCYQYDFTITPNQVRVLFHISTSRIVNISRNYEVVCCIYTLYTKL